MYAFENVDLIENIDSIDLIDVLDVFKNITMLCNLGFWPWKASFSHAKIIILGPDRLFWRIMLKYWPGRVVCSLFQEPKKCNWMWNMLGTCTREKPGTNFYIGIACTQKLIKFGCQPVMASANFGFTGFLNIGVQSSSLPIDKPVRIPTVLPQPCEHVIYPANVFSQCHTWVLVLTHNWDTKLTRELRGLPLTWGVIVEEAWHKNWIFNVIFHSTVGPTPRNPETGKFAYVNYGMTYIIRCAKFHPDIHCDSFCSSVFRKKITIIENLQN